MAYIGIGAKLEFENGSGWAEVLHCKSVNLPDFNVASIETTHLGLTNYGKTFMPGMIDAGSISFEAEYTADTYADLQGLVRETLGWRISDPTGPSVVVTCDGFLTSLKSSMSADEEMMITGEIKLTGVPEVTGA